MNIRRLFEKIYYKKEILKIFFNLLFFKERDIYFFFPLYQFGGAERVHVRILEIFSKYNTACFITNNYEESFVQNEFYKNTKVIDCSSLHETRKQRLLNKLVARKINSSKKPIIFGCNTTLFYNVIPLLKESVKVIDLLHAFSYELTGAPEKISLPLVNRIDKRVVLGNKTFLDFKKIYKENHIDSSFLERIHIIRNKVSIPNEYPEKPSNRKLNILFVGRNSYEKRPKLFFKIAEKCKDKKIDAFFKIIGDFESTKKYSENLEIIGLIKEKEKLDEYYRNSDLLLITSSREGFPMVVLEGMAQGVVPICTDVGEISSVVNDNNKNGFLIKNRQDEELIVRDFVDIISFLESERSIIKECSKEAYITVKNNFSEEENRKAYLELFFN